MQQRTIIVTGAGQSGKSTFLHGVGSYPLTQFRPPLPDYHPRNQITVPITEDNELMLVEIPGPMRLEPILPYLPPVVGHLIIVNSARPETFRETISIFRAYSVHGAVPIIITANHRDLPDAWAIADMRTAFQIPETIPIMPCVAIDFLCVKEVLLTLLKQVLTSEEYQVACTALGVVI
ncbi:MAG: hypothetical protein J0M07_20765 [Anaerolineae bacterium]|nr:hypothetical protein [Anaerolineae bacterium]